MKDYMNPINWGKKEFEEAASAAVMVIAAIVEVYVILMVI